jgi:hypothetical protein
MSRRKLSLAALAELMALLAIALGGCGGGERVPPPVISVSFSGASSQTIQQSQSVTITAVVTNDSSGKGVTWTLNGPGALSKQTSTSVEYDAPASVAYNVAATVTATAVADPTKSASDSVTVTYPPVALSKVSSDTLAGGLGQHATEVEPDTFAFGSTIVATFQVSRIFGGGAMDVGWATSIDGGVTWTNGLLPGITTAQGGSFDGDGDPVVAYDAAHGQWLISTLAITDDANGNPLNEQLVINRSPDGINWSGPIGVNPIAVYDKDWIVCDDTSTSPFYGHCYIQWRGNKGLMNLSTSVDGGLTWSAPQLTADVINGSGGQPVVQPNGTVISPMGKLLATDMLSFSSTDGGTTWSATSEISPITDHEDAGNLRSNPLGSAEMDASGTVYFVWQDCRFRTNCSSNDIVLTTSSDGVNWTAPARVPIDPVTSAVDHFLPGLAVDRTTSGSSARLTLLYYYYPVSNCGSTCDLYLAFVSSQDGGQTWSAPVVLAGPMQLAWLAQTGDTVAAGYMIGDYFSTSYVNGNPFAVFTVAAQNSGTTFDEAMYTTAQPMLAPAGALRFSSKGEKPVPNAKSDHPPRDEYPSRNRRHPSTLRR